MSLEREIRKIMASSVQENFVKNPDCDICGDGSPCTCGESQEIDEKMNPAKHVQKNDETGMYCVYNKSGEKVKEFKDKADAVKYATDNHEKLMEKLDADDTPQVQKIVKKLKGASKAHADQAKSLEKELSDDIRNLPKDKQRALQHADKTAKPKSKVSLAPTPGIKTEESNLDEAFEEFFAEGMKVFFVSGSNAEGNVHAKNEKEALAKAKKKGIKGKITIRDKGKAVQPKLVESVNEGYEGEVKKVLDKKGIDAYFKNGKLMVSKRDKPAVMKILKGQDFDMPTIQVEEIQMKSNRFGLSVSLVDAVANVLAGKRPVDEMKMKKDDEDEKKKAKKAPVTDKDDDGDGMDPVGQEDGDIDNDGDKDDSDKFLAKKRKAIGKAMKGEKNGGKEPVDTKPKMDEGKDKKEDATPVKEADMSDAQMKRREEIVKELKKKSADFESRYGDKADDVMYATATKMAMKGK